MRLESASRRASSSGTEAGEWKTLTINDALRTYSHWVLSWPRLVQQVAERENSCNMSLKSKSDVLHKKKLEKKTCWAWATAAVVVCWYE